MDFAANRAAQIEEMLELLGLSKVEELFSQIPRQLQLSPPTEDDGISEFEGMELMEALSNENSYPDFDSYLGAGSYEHHLPALVGAICSRSEFLTSYTPYQPEASQGLLQTIFEFQTAICALTGLEVANASLYDGASACAEAALMAIRCKKGRNKIVVARSLHPHYRAVVEQYLRGRHFTLVEIPFLPCGRLDLDRAADAVDEKTAALLVQSPNFFGIIEEFGPLIALAKERGALTVRVANPLTYGLFASAEELGFDIAVGDCQPFGMGLNFGGPYCGYLACRQALVRQLPGRVVGKTVDSCGREGFVLTLQTREQHIRREKATSNICTNQALAALAALVAMSWYGRCGLPRLALTNYRRAAYLKERLEALPTFSPFTTAPCFNEFVVRSCRPIADLQEQFRQEKIEPGVDLGRFFPELAGHLLIAVTETKSQKALDRYLQVAGR